MKKLGIVAVYAISMLTSLERQNTKPFNPLLGETFEFVTDNYKFIAEQVEHHPPITAWHCKGNSGYEVWTNSKAKSKFTGKSMSFIPTFRHYV